MKFGCILASVGLFLLPIHALHAKYPGAASYHGYAYPIDLIDAGPCIPTDINDAGQVIGVNYKDSYSRLGFVTGRNGLGSLPLSLGGKDSIPTAINSRGFVVGVSDVDEAGLVSSAYIADSLRQTIHAIGPHGMILSAINDLGQVAGQVGGTAYISGPDGKDLRPIHSLGTFTSIAAMNRHGQLTGQFSDQLSIYHAFVTGPDGVGMEDLTFPGAAYSDGADINDNGEVTGTQWFSEPRSREQYIASHRDTGPVLLGTLGDLPAGLSEGGGINNKGVIVGTSSKGDKYGRIYVTIIGRDGVMKNLNRYVENLPEGVYLTSSPVVNNRNQIAARGSDGLCYIVCPNADCQKFK